MERDALQAELVGLTGAGDAARSEITAMGREIDRLQTRVNDLRFNWVYYLRNAPFMDSFNPSVRINQVVLNNVRFDLNFTDAPRVDRCQSCHLGAAAAEYSTSEQPFTTHPRLDLFVADDSIHRATVRENVEIADRTGGGDSFCSAVVAALLDGRSAADAVQWGAAHGILVQETPGDTTMVRRRQIEAEIARAAKGGGVSALR